LNVKEYTDRYLPFLEHRLTPQRLRHSVGVMRVMGQLAEIFGLDRTSAMTAGLLHDAAKDMKWERQLAVAEEAGIAFSYPCERHPVYLHARLGAYLVSKELGITDNSILEAISTHSYAGNGANFDAILPRCLRAADLLAPSQEWTGRKRLRGLVYAGRMDEAVLLQSRWLIEFFRERGIPVHPNLLESYQRLSARLGAGDSFFERW